MATKMKGLYKSLKFISQIFAVKERGGEMEIGYPTDVKHVAHIGWDGPSGAAPSWMNEFKNGPEFSASSASKIGEQRDSNPISLSPWSSQDFEQNMGRAPVAAMFKDLQSKELPNVPKKHKRNKTKSASSISSSSSKSSRPAKGKFEYCEVNSSPRLQGV